jgi:hypothetical protein
LGGIKMIIERKYEYLSRLVRLEPKVDELYKKACTYDDSKGYDHHLYEHNLNYRPFELKMGSCIKLNDLLNGLFELDIKEPYDNGFSLNDVNTIQMIDRSYRAMEDWNSEDETPAWILYAFMRIFDGVEHIVKVEKIVE